MSCFLGLVVEKKTVDYNFTGPRFKSWLTAIFSYDFLLGGYLEFNVLGPAVANFELMINSHMMNSLRVRFSSSILSCISLLKYLFV